MREAAAQKLIDEGWLSVSNRYRILAKMPEGVDPRQALFEAEMKRHVTGDVEYWKQHYKRWTNGLGVDGCKSYYLRCHGEANGCWRTITPQTFAAFKRLGGKSA